MIGNNKVGIITIQEIIQWTVKNTAFVHALATIILVLVTILHIALNKKIMHSPHQSFVRPTNAHVTDENWEIELKNYGPGLALDVRIKKMAIIKNDKVKDMAKKDIYLSKFHFSEGSFELAARSSP